MKKIMSALLLICLLLTSCKYPDISELTSNSAGTSTTEPNTIEIDYGAAYGNYDYSKKPYLTSLFYFYQNKVYTNYGGPWLEYFSLNDLSLEGDRSTSSEKANYKKVINPEIKYTCPADDHQHGELSVNPICPVNNFNFTLTLLDPYESAGSYPIFYVSFSIGIIESDEIEPDSYIPPDPYNPSDPFALYRYDSSTNIREKLVELPGMPHQMMAYGYSIYVMLSTAESDYQLMVYDKNTKECKYANVGEGRIEFISADDNNVYFCDWYDGTLYRSDPDLSNIKQIYKLDEVYNSSIREIATIGMFIHDGMLYYRADFEVFKVPISETQSADLIKYKIKRLPLSALDGEGEIVATDVLQDGELNVVGNNLYYVPADLGEKQSGCYYNLSNGRYCKVDLDTLECTDLLTDSGLFFDNGCYGVATERYVVTTIRALTTQWEEKWSYQDAAGYFVLYDLETGSLFPLFKH